MHNSQNLASSKATFISTVLAQAKLSDMSIPSSDLKNTGIQAIPSVIAKKTEQHINPNISEVPTFHTPTITLPEVTPELRM